MTAYECDRCGTLLKRECMPKTTIAKKNPPLDFIILTYVRSAKKNLKIGSTECSPTAALIQR